MRIEARNLSKSYDGKSVLKNFNFSIESGEIKCIMGSSGSGKTTFLRLLLGLEKPDSGDLIFSDMCRWGVVFQENRLLEHLNASANLRFALGQDYDASLASSLLASLGLSDVSEKPVKEYSGGMKRRLALARALLARSNVLILDEPFSGLDEENRSNCVKQILSNAPDKPVILVTHNPEDSVSLHADIVRI